MDKPGWEQREDMDNLELERLIEEEGERESRRTDWNRWQGDPLGLEDGRPGLPWTAALGPYWVTRLDPAVIRQYWQ